MDDAFFVRCFQSIRNLVGDSQRVVHLNSSAFQTVVQRRPFDQFEHDGVSAVDLFKPVDRGDVRMVERRQSTSFQLKPGEPIRVLLQRSRQYLDRNITTQLRVAGPVYLAMPPAPSND